MLGVRKIWGWREPTCGNTSYRRHLPSWCPSSRIAQSATDEQFTAWCAAQPRVTAQANGSITVRVAGTIPTIDILVEVLIV